MDKVLQMLSLAHRAGKVALGYDAVVGAVQRGASLVLLSTTLSERTQRNIRRVCQERRCELYEVSYDTDTIRQYTGKPTGIVAVTDANLAKAIRAAGEPWKSAATIQND